jgi:DNA polymerase I-like protein with 3'-5' exonuclease and polymerase domains
VKINLDEYLDSPSSRPSIDSDAKSFSGFGTTPYRIAVVLDCPKPPYAPGLPSYSGSDALLHALVAKTGIPTGNILWLYVSSDYGDEDSYSPTHPSVVQGCVVVRELLTLHRPNIVLLVGELALRCADMDAQIGTHRGSLFIGKTQTFTGFKCIATYHPVKALKSYELTPVMGFDIQRAKEQSLTPELSLPQRELVVDLSCEDVLNRLRDIQVTKPPVSFDIEGYVTNGMTCCSLSTDPSVSFIIGFSGVGGHVWSEEEELQIWRELAKVLSDPTIPKILQNGLYDAFVCKYRHHITIKNIVDDTMLKHWELLCELEKSLAFLTSIYTLEPYYKNERTSLDLRKHWEYCCKDSAVTLEISNTLNKVLAGDSLTHYRMNMSLLPALLYMEVRGMRYNSIEAARRQTNVLEEAKGLQTQLDTMVMGFTSGATKALNVQSPKQMSKFLYTDLKLPIQLNFQTKKPTSNYEALLKLRKITNHPVLQTIIDLRDKYTHASMLGIYSDPDGRIRCGYNIVGTETGRLTCYTSPTGSGYNLQTIPEYDRDLFQADEGYEFFQCDLSGADGWTVAAHCSALGDHTMLEDLQYGIKIAKLLALMVKHGADISKEPRDVIKHECAKVAKDDQIYFAAKCCQHGSNYGMKETLLANTIFKQSEGRIWLEPRQAKRFQMLYHQRYFGLQRWHDAMQRKCSLKPSIKSASGNTRTFFGRPKDAATFRAMLSHEPQANTTYATNLAAWKLWHDPTNRRPDGSLRVEPLHQVHDALNGQWRVEDRDYAIASLKRWFNNPLKIAGIDITIPFEGGYGDSWGNCKNSI